MRQHAQKVTLYSKPDCPLCSKAKRLLEKLQPEFGFGIEEVDITRDEALYERYRWEIPVIAVGDRELLKGRIAEEPLREVLRSAFEN